MAGLVLAQRFAVAAAVLLIRFRVNAAWLVLSGSLVKGIVLTLVALLVLGQIDNVVRPLLLAGKSQMSTLVLIISLLGGVSAFGFIGIVLGPLVAALLTALFESYEAPAPPVAATPVGGGAVATAGPTDTQPQAAGKL